jgi:hypothetical protein
LFKIYCNHIYIIATTITNTTTTTTTTITTTTTTSTNTTTTTDAILSDWDPVQGFTFDIVCVVGLPADVTHARARISLHDGADLVSPVYTTDAAEAFYSGGMGGRTVKLGGANGEKRSFTHVIPSQGLVLVVELEVLKHDHGEV